MLPSSYYFLNATSPEKPKMVVFVKVVIVYLQSKNTLDFREGIVLKVDIE